MKVMKAMKTSPMKAAKAMKAIKTLKAKKKTKSEQTQQKRWETQQYPPNDLDFELLAPRNSAIIREYINNIKRMRPLLHPRRF